jgi:NAD(P)-dependent dehydrogenase (short-subunit alcohol dehydrogenase family)
MKSLTSRIALIAGANKGIGLDIFRQVSKARHRVLLGVRDVTLGEAASVTNDWRSCFPLALAEHHDT